MKLKGETHNEYKQKLLKDIKLSRYMIRTWDWLIKRNRIYYEAGYKTLEIEQRAIKNNIKELAKNERDKNGQE